MKTGFGWIQFGKKTYDHDIIIHADGSVTKRKKKASKELKEAYGHTPLSEYELEFLNDEKPEVVYIGTGQHGSLPVTSGAKKILSAYTIILLPTNEILPWIEREGRTYVALLHVTC